MKKTKESRMYYRNSKSQKGITLVALVVTIIVLIILASVSINVLFGAGGLFTKAKEATQNWTLAEQDEIDRLANLEFEINEYLKGDTSVFDGTVNNPKSNLGGLIPIKYEEGAWVEADENNTENDWYNYVEQIGTSDGKTSMWANAQTDDESCKFVWIPRYAYKIIYNNPANRGQGGKIDVIFLQGNTNKDKNGNDIPSDYIVHPAFSFGEKELTGLWVGKFQSSPVNGSQGASGDVVKITPGNYWTGINVSTMFAKSTEVASHHGLDGDSHMLKNSEWGAVAYLAHSKYGRNGNSISSGDSYNYHTPSVMLTSTTGNVYGVYDMVGSTSEYVMGVLEDKNGNPRSGRTANDGSNSGFNGICMNGTGTDEIETMYTGGINFPDSKYYDLYNRGSLYDGEVVWDNYPANSDKKGDAVFETSSGGMNDGDWSGNQSYFLDWFDPWMLRGRTASTGSGTGLFMFSVGER